MYENFLYFKSLLSWKQNTFETLHEQNYIFCFFFFFCFNWYSCCFYVYYQEKALTSLENSAQIFNLLSDLPGEIKDIELLLEVFNLVIMFFFNDSYQVLATTLQSAVDGAEIWMKHRRCEALLFEKVIMNQHNELPKSWPILWRRTHFLILYIFCIYQCFYSWYSNCSSCSNCSAWN